MLIAFIDILRSDFKGNNKIVWVLVVFTHQLFWCYFVFFNWKTTENKEPKNRGVQAVGELIPPKF